MTKTWRPCSRKTRSKYNYSTYMTICVLIFDEKNIGFKCVSLEINICTNDKSISSPFLYKVI